MGIDLRGSYLFWSVFGKLTSQSRCRLLGESASNFSFPRDIFMTCLPEIMCARIVNEMSLWKWRCRISSTASIAASQPPARDKASVFVVCVRQRNPIPSTITTDWGAFLANLLAHKIFSKSIKHIKINLVERIKWSPALVCDSLVGLWKSPRIAIIITYWSVCWGDRESAEEEPFQLPAIAHKQTRAPSFWFKRLGII